MSPNALAPLPWTVAYDGGASVEDADGRTIAECITPAVALLIVEVVNNARAGRLLNTQLAWDALDAALRLLEG